MKSNNGSSGTDSNFGSAFDRYYNEFNWSNNKGITGSDVVYATYTSANSVKY